jgi:hypothetical protein
MACEIYDVARVDAALDSVLKASGSALRNYTMPSTLNKMRDAMELVMLEMEVEGRKAVLADLSTPSPRAVR